MPLIGCTAVFNKGADGEGHFEVYTKLNKIKILFIEGSGKAYSCGNERFGVAGDKNLLCQDHGILWVRQCENAAGFAAILL